MSLFLTVPWVYPWSGIVALSGHTHLFHDVVLKYVFRPRGYKSFFMLNSTGHEISTAYKTKKLKKNDDVSCFKSIRCCINHAFVCLCV